MVILYSLEDFQHIYDINGFAGLGFTGMHLFVVIGFSILLSLFTRGYFSQPGFHSWLRNVIPLVLLFGVPASAYYWEINDQKNRLEQFLENRASMKLVSLEGLFTYSKLGQGFFFELDRKNFVVDSYSFPYGCNNEHLFSAIRGAESKKVRVTLIVYSDTYQERKEDIENFATNRHINNKEPLFISACVSSIEVIS